MTKTFSTASLSIAEMREYASFEPDERSYIERSLDIAFDRSDAFKSWVKCPADSAAIRSQYVAYRELEAMRDSIPNEDSLAGIALFTGALIRISAQDLVQEKLTSFGAYRFLYERLLGAKARPYLPSGFCGAAALPQIRPEHRRVLLQSLSESAATAPAWSDREPIFLPEKILSDAA